MSEEKVERCVGVATVLAGGIGAGLKTRLGGGVGVGGERGQRRPRALLRVPHQGSAATKVFAAGHAERALMEVNDVDVIAKAFGVGVGFVAVGALVAGSTLKLAAAADGTVTARVTEEPSLARIRRGDVDDEGISLRLLLLPLRHRLPVEGIRLR